MESALLGPVGALLVLVAGWLGGACGIGGVLMVPTITAIEQVDPHKAIAATSVAFGLMGTLAWLRFRHEGRPMVGGATLMVATAPGAALGSLLVHGIPTGWLMTGLALLLIGSAARQRAPHTAMLPNSIAAYCVHSSSSARLSAHRYRRVVLPCRYCCVSAAAAGYHRVVDSHQRP